MRGFLLLLLVSASFGAGAQDLARRHALISTAYKAERYAEVAQLIDLQLREAAVRHGRIPPTSSASMAVLYAS